MIGSLSGQVLSIDASSALIEVHGVGYEVRMPASDLNALHIGQETHMFTSLNVSQDAITLFGFLEAGAKSMFLQLQKVSGIGPKVALSILSTLPSEQLAQAIHNADVKALAQSPGLGKKGAQKIILELQGSMQLEQASQKLHASTVNPQDKGYMQIIEGLISLGFTQQDATHTVDAVLHEHEISMPIDPQEVPQVLKFALTSLDRGR